MGGEVETDEMRGLVDELRERNVHMEVGSGNKETENGNEEGESTRGVVGWMVGRH